MTRILIVEDEVSLREDLISYLEARGYDSCAVGTLEKARERLNTDIFDVIILDLGLPDGHGVQLLTETRADYGLRNGIIVLTAHHDLEDKLSALEAGADAYLIKHASLREIEFTIRNVLKRLPAPSLLSAEEWRLEQQNRLLIAPSGDNIRLTPKEFEFLASLAEVAGDICHHTHLTEGVRSTADSNTNSLTAMVRRLRQKIKEQTGKDSPIRAAYGKGYRFSAALSVNQ